MMAENSKIEWTDHTANFWWGCFKVSPGCQNCYADTWATRWGKDILGPAKSTNREIKNSVWSNVLKWDREAREAGKRVNLFTMSMGDFLEDHPQLHEPRNRAIDLLYHLTNTNVQMLTKRPENAVKFLPESWFDGDWPAHIWIGTSIENQEQADKRIPKLLKIPAAVRFLSMEPLLGPVDLTEFQPFLMNKKDGFLACRGIISGHVDWVIVGGESGPNARPMHPDWARSVRDQCVAAGVPFFFKQWGEWVWWIDGNITHIRKENAFVFDDKYQTVMAKVGKKAAGRLLDGEEWNQFPAINMAQ